MKKGIDISKWQGTVDFTKVATQVDFVILREGYGNTIDSKFLEYVKGCQKSNINIHGVYHFIYATNSKAAREEAASAIENVIKAGLPKTTRIWADLEYDTIEKAKSSGVTLGKDEINLFTKTFCKAITDAGYKTGIYTNIDYYKNYYTQELLNKYPIWLADYSGEPDFECSMHQYSSSGKVSGISGNVDMDYCYCDECEEDTMSNIENAVSLAEQIANDDTHGYDQVDRWGNPNYDCSGLVISCLEKSGIPVKTNGATYTGNMYDVFIKTGFKDVIKDVNLETGKGMIRGDVLLKTNSHTAFYCGDGKLVHASINEKGTVTGGKSGDQTGKEICIRSYYNKPWNHVLRYKGTTSEEKTTNTEKKSKAPTFKTGNVYTLQVELKVRTGAGTNYTAKKHSELSADGQKHDTNKNGCLDAGTKITCKAVKNVGDDIWIKSPSGWLAAYYDGKVYIK